MLTDSSNYDYAVPELSSAPLLTKRRLDSLSERATELMTDDKLVEIDTRRSAGSVRSKHSTRVCYYTGRQTIIFFALHVLYRPYDKIDFEASLTPSKG